VQFRYFDSGFLPKSGVVKILRSIFLLGRDYQHNFWAIEYCTVVV